MPEPVSSTVSPVVASNPTSVPPGRAVVVAPAPPSWMKSQRTFSWPSAFPPKAGPGAIIATPNVNARTNPSADPRLRLFFDVITDAS